MKKIIKYINCSIGVFLIICSLILLTNNNIDSYIGVIDLFSLAIVFLPVFDIFCQLVNKKFSIWRKICLGFGTFFLPALVASTNNSSSISTLYDAVIILVIYWVIMFVTDKKVFVEEKSYVYMKEIERDNIFFRVYNKIAKKHNDKIRAGFMSSF